MDAREVKLIRVAGQNGMPAPESWSGKAGQAPSGQPGENGRSAGAPAAGQAGANIRLRLAYSDEESGVVQVTGEGTQTGQRWKIARDEKLLLNAKGGDGGAGGRGENGQAGGRGRDGRHATRHHNAEDGQDGAHGGSGGYGSNGADGAAGGHIFITVSDDDTDLLLPLEFDVQGGAGGQSGQHGEPGDGGIGGRGGRAFAWAERHGNMVIRGSRPGGTNGSNGSPGMRPSTYLTGGKSGQQGSVQVRVIRGDLTESTYPGPYIIHVVSFDIVDENRDGINEPGEHLLVHNIRVKNTGGMPSPGTRAINLLIQGTQYLQPIASEPVELPYSIQPGQEIDVPGILRAYISNEGVGRVPTEHLNYQDSVQIVATFSGRLSRPIPNFCGPSQIDIRYPLRLDPPTYLDCVAKGDRVRFKWVVHNDSTKPYGVEGILRRAVATKLSDPNRWFSFAYASIEKPDEATDEIPDLLPNSMITIDQDFTIDERALEFSEGYLSLELLLSDPMTGSMRSIQTHQMHLQISATYRLSPNPSYLLIVNSQTPNYAIHQIIDLVRNRLHTNLDIFNLSLTGSYKSPVTGESVLKSYIGRSIIIFGNSFQYFNQGEMLPWDLLDPWETGLMAKGGTNILFVGVADLKAVQEWATKATFPAHDITAGKAGTGDADAVRVVATIRKADPRGLTSEMYIHGFSVRKPIFGSLQPAVDSAANSMAGKLNKNFPLRRFMVVPDAAATTEPKRDGAVLIFEGIPKNSKMVACSGLFPKSSPGTNLISDYNMFFIISILPFEVRARMFWNMLGNGDANGVSCAKLYTGMEAFTSATGPAVVNEKILRALCMSLQFDISSEIYLFTSTKPRFPNRSDIDEKLTALPLMKLFFAQVPQQAQVLNLAQAQLLVSTLGTVHAVSNPIGLWQAIKGTFAFLGNRKGQLTPSLNQRIYASISAVCGASIAAEVKKSMHQRSKQVKAGIKASGNHKNFTNFGIRELAELLGLQNVPISDLAQLNPLSVALKGSRLQDHTESYHIHRQSTQMMELGAKAMLSEIVNPVVEEIEL